MARFAPSDGSRDWLRWRQRRRWWWWNVNPPGPGDVRITEDGQPRVTEDGLFLRVTEDAI